MFLLLLPVFAVAVRIRNAALRPKDIASMSVGDLAKELISSNQQLFDSPPPPAAPDADLANEDRRNRDSELPTKLGIAGSGDEYLDKLWNWVKGVAGYSVDTYLPYPLHSTNYLNQYVYERSFDPSDSRDPTIAGDIMIDPSWSVDRPPYWNLWSNGSSIPYFIVSNDSCARAIISEAMLRFKEASNGCIAFTEATAADPNVLMVSTGGTECYASLGFVKGANVLSLGTGCKNVGTAMHLLGHVIGMAHEDQRANARDFVAVNPANIDVYGMSTSSAIDPTTTSKYSLVFKALNNTRTQWEKAIQTQPYEYGSLMHNSRSVYSVDASTDLTLKGAKGPQFEDLMGQRGLITERDTRIMNEMYSCQRLPIKVADRLFVKPLSIGVTYDTLNTCLIQDAQEFRAGNTIRL